MTKKLYVGNLSFQTTESELNELFAQAGVVETVRIITDRETGRSKGFGFVEMQDGADKAIEQFEASRDSFDPAVARQQAERFDRERFTRELIGYIEAVLHPRIERRAA